MKKIQCKLSAYMFYFDIYKLIHMWKIDDEVKRKGTSLKSEVRCRQLGSGEVSFPGLQSAASHGVLNGRE